MWRAWLAIVIVGAVLAGCGDDDDPAERTAQDDPVATVGDESIMERDVLARVKLEWPAVLTAHELRGVALPEPPDFAACEADLREHEGDGDGERPPTCAELYRTLRDRAVESLITEAWTRQSAAQLGVTISDDELQRELDRQRAELFVDEEDYQAFLSQNGLTDEEFSEQLEAGLLMTRVNRWAIDQETNLSPERIARHYRKHRDRYRIPSARLVYSLRTETKAEAQQALDELREGATWREVVAKYGKGAGPVSALSLGGAGTDAATRLAFASDPGRIRGPIQLGSEWLIFEVVRDRPARQRSLSEVEDEIAGSVLTERERTAVLRRLDQLREDWRSRTRCRDDVELEVCGGAL